MCLGRRNLSRKARILLGLGNLCMFTGLGLSRFSGTGSAQHINTMHFLTGLLLGIAVTLLFAAIYRARRDQNLDQPPTTDAQTR